MGIRRVGRTSGFAGLFAVLADADTDTLQWYVSGEYGTRGAAHAPFGGAAA
ncbi:hypothetical protein GCM10010274_56460 [Streptomyces lavendofoliae]|uniref:Uncharacterized protein n=1 Tax=Streptomyces lavendofoliae TaxID=67314 RepID=A0A918M7N9_9ACTN|nr:hypothetical protein GCM10010274_56460 [Streptomyces lavendofoliae]